MLYQVYFDFRDVISYLQGMGVYDVFLPFLLVFAIVFAALEKTKILGADKSNINAIVALVVGLLLIVQKSIVDAINSFLPRVSMIIVVVLMFLLVISMVAGGEYKGIQSTLFAIAVVAMVIAFYFALSPSDLISQQDRDSLLKIIIPLAIFGLLFWFVTGGKKEKGEGALSKIAKGIEDSWKK